MWKAQASDMAKSRALKKPLAHRHGARRVTARGTFTSRSWLFTRLNFCKKKMKESRDGWRCAVDEKGHSPQRGKRTNHDLGRMRKRLHLPPIKVIFSHSPADFVVNSVFRRYFLFAECLIAHHFRPKNIRRNWTCFFCRLSTRLFQ